MDLDRIEFDGDDCFVVYDDERIAKRERGRWAVFDPAYQLRDIIIDGEVCVEVQWKRSSVRELIFFEEDA